MTILVLFTLRMCVRRQRSTCVSTVHWTLRRMKDPVHGKFWQSCLYGMGDVFCGYCFMMVVVYDMLLSSRIDVYI